MHSPLVGPATMAGLAQHLRLAGARVDVADLRPGVDDAEPSWRAVTQCVDAEPGAIDVLVVHSGAGPLAPILAHRLQPAAVAYIDAVVPGLGTEHHPSAESAEFLDRLPVVDGRLPPWHEWWEPKVMSELVPDPTLRATITAETRALPRALCTLPIPLPDKWPSGACHYLQLSPAYAEHRARAIAYGWPTAAIEVGHLGLVTHPAEIAAWLLDLPRRGG